MPVPPATRISSRQHAVVQRCRRVARRDEPGAVLLDGEHVIDEALHAGVPFEFLLTDGRDSPTLAAAERTGVTIHQVTSAVLDAASPVRTPSGLVAVARWTPTPIASAFDTAPALIAGLCGVQDPGNVGSAIRAADALGATAVLVLDDSADPGAWKALRGAMGSTFHLPVAVGTTAEALTIARSRGVRVAATISGDRGHPPTGLDRPTLLLFGREGSGLPDDVMTRADARFTIAMRPRVDSLNVAVTCALMLYEARRQRSSAS